jgi:hypothetical protein
MFKGVSWHIPTVGILYFAPLNPFQYSPLPLHFPHPIFQQLSVHILISAIFIDVMFYNVTDALSFFFPFPLSSSSCHYYKNVLHMSLYMIMLVLCICLSFGFICHVWENTCGLCLSEPGLLHLTWGPPIASIYLQTICHYSL